MKPNKRKDQRKHMDKIEDLIERLQGTMMTFDEGCLDVGLDPDEVLEQDRYEIENEIFLCETCGWWCESHENVDGETCKSCYEDYESPDAE